MLVSVELRKKQVLALVVGVRSAKENRTTLRNQSFTLKKITARKPAPFLTPNFMETLEKVSNYYASSIGSIIYSIIPQTLLSHSDKLSQSKAVPIQKRHLDKRVFQTNDEDRISSFKGLIRESFARNESIFFCFPSHDALTETASKLEKGIEEHTYLLYRELPTKKMLATWNMAVSHNHPVVIFGNASFLHIPRPDIGTIVVERESSRFYKTLRRPYIDYRVFVELYAECHGATLILADSLLRISTLWKFEQGDFIEYSTVCFKYITSVEKLLVDMKKQDTVAEGFQILSKELKQLIDLTEKEKSRLVILAPRRGLAPITVCSDCGTVVRCLHCSTPVTLHERSEGNVFVCHKCGDRRSAEERCAHCTSWNLTPLGIGIERVEKEIRMYSKKIQIFRIDKDTTPSRRTQKSHINNFLKSKGGILLGTEMLLSRLNKNVPYSAIVSLDALFSLPEYSINEKIIHSILALQTRTYSGFILQTRDPERSVFSTALGGNLNTFYQEEIKARQMLSYPPFSLFIKITASGKQETVEQEMKKMEHLFEDVDIITFPAFHERIKGKYVMNALIKIPTSRWPDKGLVEQLRALPPYFAVNIGPESIL